jgi:hypothetical protein
MTDFKFYRLNVKHDNGKDFFIVSATSDINAIILLQAAQGCPKSAILSVKEISPKQRKKLLGR